jgi:hypothetical protein
MNLFAGVCIVGMIARYMHFAAIGIWGMGDKYRKNGVLCL